jgi:hypothetical protein
LAAFYLLIQTINNFVL